jgi:phage baseplate assembly protein W
MSNIRVRLDNTTENKRRGYIYRDVDFKFILSESSFDFKTFDDINSVRNGIKNIFTWRRGERIILPEFGNLLYLYLYEPMTPQVLNDIQREVRDMITRWEPRVKIANINIETFPDDNEIKIQIEYSIPTLSNEILSFSTILNERES